MLVNNLQTLEFMIRGFFINLDEKAGYYHPELDDLCELEVGQTIKTCAFSDERSLRQLIVDYNTWQVLSADDLLIDTNIADVRDAIAHGRVFLYSNAKPRKLLRFDIPQGDSVRVRAFIDLTERWLDKQIDIIIHAIIQVEKSIKNIENDSPQK
jgi:hypothetical protein